MALREMGSGYAISDCKYDNLSLRHRVWFGMFTKMALLKAICPHVIQGFSIFDDRCMQPELELSYQVWFRGYWCQVSLFE